MIAKVDADRHKEIGSRYDAASFPTLKFFPAGSNKFPEMYNDAREVNDMLTYVNKKASTFRKADGTLMAEVGRVGFHLS